MALVLSGSIDISGSMTATTIIVSAPGVAGMVSSSAQIRELVPLMQTTASLNLSTGSIKAEIAGIESYTASLKSSGILSSSAQIQNYNLFAVTSSANTFYGNQTISGSLNVSTEVKSTAFISYRGSISLASGATGTIFTMNTMGLYTVQAVYTGAATNFTAVAIFFAHSGGGGYAKCIDLFDGANITLSNSGASIQVQNNGFATYDFNWSILFQPTV
jgi:hypothetical protein